MEANILLILALEYDRTRIVPTEHLRRRSILAVVKFVFFIPCMHPRPVLPTPLNDLEIVVTDDGSRTLRLKGTQVTWHSESGALAESELVFLQNSAVHQRLQQGLPTRVLEIGLGTGLNFWITASLAIRTNTPLHYVSTEPNLMAGELVKLLQHGKLESCRPAFDLFCKPIFELHSVRCTMERVAFDRLENIAALKANVTDLFDAIYHDPFGPDVAPELWSAQTFAELKSFLKPSGRLVTYCVKSSIQQVLKSTGFRLEKTRGPVGGKREVLIAIHEPG